MTKIKRVHIFTIFFAVIALNTAELVSEIDQYRISNGILSLYGTRPAPPEDAQIVQNLYQNRKRSATNAAEDVMQIALVVFLWYYFATQRSWPETAQIG
jgi:hypothetical protein